MTQLVFEIGLVIVVATVLAGIARLFKQPLILAYIVAGILIGPTVAGIITNLELIRNVSELGIAFLLFMVGMEMDLRKMKNVGTAVLMTGIVQVSLTFVAGFLVASYLGFAPLTAGYIAIALGFGSTMVVIKLLSDKKKLDTLYGRSVLGILLIQDIIAILVLTLLPNITNPSFTLLGISVLKGAILFGAAIIPAKFLIPRISKFMASSSELLFLGSLAWLFLLAIIASLLDYSIAIGAFLAGVTLASLQYSPEIIGRIKPLRDFFATLFFVALGMQINFSYLLADPRPIFFFTPIVLFFTPLVDTVMLSLFGYTKRSSFFTGMSLGQISEFSLIVITLGLTLGHIPQDIFSLIAVISVITITLTSYQLKYDEKIYQFLSKPLSVFEKLGKKKKIFDYVPKEKKFDVLLVGYNRLGYNILNELQKIEKKTLVVDYNPDTIQLLAKRRKPCIYGDITNAELMDKLYLETTKLVISTVPDLEANKLLIEEVKERNKNAVIITTAEHAQEALDLYKAGSDFVIVPHMISGEHVSLLLHESRKDFKNLRRRKRAHVRALKFMRGKGHGQG